MSATAATCSPLTTRHSLALLMRRMMLVQANAAIP
jgi:hypothetical protein